MSISSTAKSRSIALAPVVSYTAETVACSMRAVFKLAGPGAPVVMNHEVFELALIIWFEMLALLGRVSARMQQFVRAQAQVWHRAACSEAQQWCRSNTWHEAQSSSHCLLAAVLACVLLAGCCQLPSRAAAAPLALAAPLAERATPCLAQCMQDALLERLQTVVERAHDSVERAHATLDLEQAHATLDLVHDALHDAMNRMAINCHKDMLC